MGITGASGAIYADRFVRRAANHYNRIHLIVTDQAVEVFSTELCRDVSKANLSVQSLFGQNVQNVELVQQNQFFTPPASGSYACDGMVIVPCSMGTLGRIANGISNDLMTRAADVALKESRKLILVPRESPLNLIMVRNMAAVIEAGATLIPAMPAWYHRPSNLDELADTVVARIFQHLDLPREFAPEWMV